jgi:hypothetical protein
LPIAFAAALTIADASSDPISAALEAHTRTQADIASFDGLDIPDDCPMMDRFEAACDAAWTSSTVVCDTMPTTLAGVAAFVGFMRVQSLEERLLRGADDEIEIALSGRGIVSGLARDAELAAQHRHLLLAKAQCVTHVSGTNCHPSLRKGNSDTHPGFRAIRETGIIHVVPNLLRAR